MTVKHAAHKHEVANAQFLGVGQTDFTEPKPPEVVEYGVYRDDPKCPKVIYQPGGKRNVQFVLSTEPLGPDKAFGLRITPTSPGEQIGVDEGGNPRGVLDSLVNIEPMTPAQIKEVAEEIKRQKPADPISQVLGKLERIPLK